MIIIANQIIISNSISKQSSDAETINIAGKQRMYSQLITKMALYTKNANLQDDNISNLKKVIDSFKKADTYLKQKNKLQYNIESLDILFNKNTPYFNKIISSSNKLIEDPNNEVVFNQFFETIKNNEQPFLNSMDAIVNEYQKLSENRLSFLKKMEYFFITFTSISLFAIIFFMFLPMFRKNKALTNLNKELEKFKKEIEQKEKDKKSVEEILHRTNSVARIGTWEVDLINKEVSWSKVTKEIHNTKNDYIPSLEKGIDFYKEGYSRDRITKVIDNSIKNNSSWDEELQIVTAQGKNIWVRAIGQPEFINNECVRLYGTFQDINTVKLAQIELKKANEELNAILDSGTISIIRTDTNGIITYFNEGAEKLLGYKSEELINKKTTAIFHDKEEVLKRGKKLSTKYKKEITGFDLLTRLARNNKVDSTKWTYIKKDGTSIDVQLSVSAIRDKKGNIVAFLGVGTDITKLTEQNKQLASFAQIASHNLRAPVSNLSSLLDLYDICETSEEKEFTFGKFRTVIAHLSETLNTLIEAIKIREKRESNIEIKTLSFSKVFKKTEEIISEKISRLNAVIISDFSSIDTIKYNESYLESIFINLISNSLRYSSPERAPRIEVTTTINAGKIELKITDNGLGIDLEKHGHKLFGLNQVFHRHKDSKGVGLYIVKNQIESLKGTISCTSEIDKGTTFTITF
ncbi:PAS domain S-box protein [Polaribacter sp. KT25b]|uniref:PAS domain S-box protein n=1 Tax=Polaribacter sp. KT25b TaxID=1855336 RepID=UPI0012FD0770|nr:PAS domain S-box protein [Polaribacter sp. KT25b]